MSAKQISSGGFAKRYPPPGPVVPKAKPAEETSESNFAAKGAGMLRVCAISAELIGRSSPES
jgi:hypothetical protein